MRRTPQQRVSKVRGFHLPAQSTRATFANSATVGNAALDSSSPRTCVAASRAATVEAQQSGKWLSAKAFLGFQTSLSSLEFPALRVPSICTHLMHRCVGGHFMRK